MYRSGNKEKQLEGINKFLKNTNVFEVNSVTADYYGAISADLFKKGKPISNNDIWIAATAKQYDLTVITKDKYFLEVEGLSVEFW